ncbi:transglycosylase domain-containing protein [Streptomyces sp. O3]
MGKNRSGGGLSTGQQIAKFLGVSVLSGAVMAGIALPAAGALGLAAKGSVEGFDEIPSNLERPPLSQRTTILDSKGDTIATVFSRDRTLVKLKDISPYMQKAIVAIEDSRFYEHGAIDLKGILRALNENAQSGTVTQGASTLTQQYVKNVFVEEAGDDPEKVAEATQQTIGRKIRELKYAIQIEEMLGKKGILENYLNITFFGQQAYGVEAASRRYFSKSAKDLELGEAALLAGLVQSPSRYDPVNDAEEATKRRNIVLQRMVETGDITQKEATEAKKKDLGLKVSRPQNGCITAVKGATFFCDYVQEVFLNDPAFGKTREDRQKIWNQGGLRIKTTLDPQAQASVQQAIKDNVNKDDEVATAVTLVEPGTGKILGMGQSRPYGYGKNETEINLSVGKDMGGGGGYQPGSTYKPIVAAAALEKGMSPTKVYGSPQNMKYPSPISMCEGRYVNTNNERVENETSEEVGPYDMKEATKLSINTYYVELLKDVGMCPVAKLSEKMGAKRADGKPLKQVPSMALGSNEMSPLTMASAYATFAARGTYCTPVAIEAVTGPDGKAMDVPKSTCSRAMSPKTADTISTLLKGVVEAGTGRQAGLGDRPSAGKTGTTDFRYAAWFVGYTPNMAGAVWVGDPAHKRKMIDITIGGRYHGKVFGGGVPGPIWKQAMSGALSGKPAPGLSTVHIPNPKKDKNEDGDGDGNSDRDPNGGNGGIGGVDDGKPQRPGGGNGGIVDGNGGVTGGRTGGGTGGTGGIVGGNGGATGGGNGNGGGSWRDIIGDPNDGSRWPTLQ